ncbi:MAG: alpha/beta hydrolase [Gammaproteobacteria bacterium]|nr:alpha/beta hydrolase [Gammaproteobacteria bacterium]
MQGLSFKQQAGVRLIRIVSASVFGYLAFKKRGIQVNRQEFRYGRHRDERLDHQKPPEGAPARDTAIIYIHGGGWIACGKKYYPADLQFLCDAGFTVFNVEYPLAPEHPNPLLLQSILRAGAWIKQEHPEFRRVHMMGDSAGANLSAMYAVLWANPELMPPLAGEFGKDDLPEPASVVSMYGLLDRETLLGDDPDEIGAVPRLFMQSYGGVETLKPGPIAPSSAITPMDLEWTNHPPCFLGVGDIDFLVESSARYATELGQRNITLTHKIYPGAPHGFFNYEHEQTPQLRQDVLEFLEGVA